MDSEMQADGEELLESRHQSSEADLYYAKVQLEERLKFAMRYDFAYETPLNYVRRFFESAFSPSVRCDTTGPIAHWQSFTERFIRNTTIFPLSQQFHPVYLAAGYLEVSRNYLLE